MPVQNGEWIDMFTAEDVTLKQFEYKIISLGISMELPEEYYTQVLPRSSTFDKFGILMYNSLGVIENDYNGDEDILGFPALAMRDTFIPKGTRIGQFAICERHPIAHFIETNHLGNKNRGGYGSTGLN